MRKRIRDFRIRIAECFVSQSRSRSCRFPQQFTQCEDIELHPEPSDEQITGSISCDYFLRLIGMLATYPNLENLVITNNSSCKSNITLKAVR
jgi:hypothetical protein